MALATRILGNRAKVRAVRIAVTTTGSAGSATGNTTSPIICGQILGVAVNWHASAPAGTSDITIEGATSGLDLYAKANAVTDVHKCPSVFGLDAAATALTSDVTPQRYCVNEGVKVTVAQSNALTKCAIVTITYRPVRAEQISITTTGGAGVSAGEASTGAIVGEILGILINFGAGPATTDITISVGGYNLYAKSDSAADAYVVPVLFGVTNANGALASDVTPQHYCAAGRVTATIAQCDDLAPAAVVTVFWNPLKAVRIKVTTTGVAGSATGSAAAQVEGEIVGIGVNCHASLPGTADLTIEARDTGIDLWARADSAADAFVAPRLYGVSNADVALTGNVTPECYAVHDYVTVSVAQGDALTDAVVVDVFVRP